jgi:hypothetical protein
MSSWLLPRRWMTTDSACRTVGELDDWSEIENARSGGSALIDVTLVAVNPTGPSPASAVMTATPPA